MSAICDCGAETETTGHFFLHCQFFANERQNLSDDLCFSVMMNASIKHLIDVLLYGSDRFNNSKNKQILLHKICYIQATKHFELTSANFCSITTVVFLSCMSA